ncbi:DUF1285 domain-containing protein [Alteromonas lipolytica]|uniref:DUF1285 domain-containing protein n=1 Tax=Alteromonas lipolytica TaxID=1856405 RepID=A0A1E8FHN2_9ALTE|nr:DUF1285 domain-containing protein [Alteromonas lipolytica]OFI35445.1 hypothetical protein BFC17_11800 [Alteromonas lipolytica]GGF76297.1 hypothetical protein GCM10011338_30610 [Alteromonas lipolytica]
MDLTTLTAQIEDLGAAPPFEKWHPPFCGDIDMTIKADGSWWYMGSPIGREKLVKLFAGVLIKEGDEFFLKTPAEKVRIKVEDAPFVITGWQRHDTDDGPAIEVISNLGHVAVLSETHPLVVDHSNPEQPRPYVTLHRGLQALVHRNVYYQWVDIAEPAIIDGLEHLVITSGKSRFSLGQL